MTYPLGVDIGTTYTAAALWRDGRVQTVPLGNRANAVPSTLFLRDDGTMLVGEPASRRGLGEPDRLAREFKRRMGDEVPILLGGQQFTAHDLTGRVLRWTVDRVAELQGGPPSHVVLTHPAEWGDYRRGLLLEAARAAGVPSVGLLPEPVAAATWYAAQERVEPGSLIGVYDFGGGTFDASVVRKTPTGVEIYGEPGGDDAIGGIDFDYALFRHVGAAAGIDVASVDQTDPAAVAGFGQLLQSVVDAKEALSADVDAVVPVLLPGVSQQVLVTRADFEGLIRDQVFGTVGVFDQVVRRAGLEPRSLHAVLLVGGSSRIPLVSQLLSSELGLRVAVDAHPKYTVSLGAAIAAAPRVAGPRPGPIGPVRPMPAPPPGPLGPRPMTPPPPQPTQPAASLHVVRPPVGPPPGAPAPTPLPVPSTAAVSEPVDLVRTGLTGATDVQAVLASIPPLRPTDQPVVIRTRERTPGTARTKGRGRAIFLVVAILAVLGVVAYLVTRPSPTPSKSDERASEPSSGNAVLPNVTLAGKLIVKPDGPDSMRGVAVTSSGDLVAVGASLHQQPRAWLRHDGKWTSTTVDSGQGTIEDVVATPKGLVAVGWSGAGDKRRPAVWSSADGAKWTLRSATGDFAPATGVTELTAVTVGPSGGLLVAAVDRRADRVDGDVAVYSSPDGAEWTSVHATGLAGPGPQSVQRIARTSHGLTAIGSALVGAHRGPAIWTSTDGKAWRSAGSVPTGTPDLRSITDQGDGKLLACGSIGTADDPMVACWRQSGDAWQEYGVRPADGSVALLYVYGLATVGGRVEAVGVGRDGDTVDAAAWTITG